MRHLLIVTVLTVVACAGVLWQVDRAGALAERGELPKLICPLH